MITDRVNRVLDEASLAYLACVTDERIHRCARVCERAECIDFAKRRQRLNVTKKFKTKK